MKVLRLETKNKQEFIDITEMVSYQVEEWYSWVLTLFVPHTTCWIMINEGYDPDVMLDLWNYLNELVPVKNYFRHLEWNSDAHIKSALIWVSLNVIVENGQLILGRWQRIFFCEFDWPRRRKIYLKEV